MYFNYLLCIAHHDNEFIPDSFFDSKAEAIRDAKNLLKTKSVDMVKVFYCPDEFKDFRSIKVVFEAAN